MLFFKFEKTQRCVNSYAKLQTSGNIWLRLSTNMSQIVTKPTL